MHKISAFVFLSLLSATASANLPGQGLNRLFSAHEWNQLCADQSSAQTSMICRSKIHRAVAYGRSLGTFEMIVPENQSLLQSRSGVFFSRNLNEMITRIKEDTGRRTSLDLQDGVQCQIYATPPDLVGVPREGRSYNPLINSWLREYTDARYEVQSIRVGRQNDKKTMQFDAITSENRAVSGVYAYDGVANAAIFATCDHPASSAQGKKNADLFFRSVIGSARKFV